MCADLRKGEMRINSSLECSIECVEGTRPSVNYAKDWLGQLFLIRGLVSSNKTISDGGITVDFWFIKVHTSN